MKKLLFQCPECSKTKLEEILINATVTTVINEITVDEQDEAEISYGEQTADDGEVQNYQCQNCGFVLEDEFGNTIDNLSKLKEYLEQNDDAELID